MRDFESRLGVAPVLGGRHEPIGTHNAILPLQEGAYVELMAPDPSNPDPPLGLPFGLADDLGPRLVTWAAGTRDIEASVESSRNAGFDPGTIADLSRATPEGRRLAWRLSISSVPVADGLVPFLIDWGDTPHPSRSAEARCSLEDFRAEHPEPEKPRSALAALGCSLEVRPGREPRLFATVVGPRGRIELS